MDFNLKNKVAVVTASTNGIGLAIALDLAKNGAKVYLAARNKEKVEKIKQDHPDLMLEFTRFDADDASTYEECINHVIHKENQLDILVNNFGGTDIKSDRTILDTSYQEYLDIINKNIGVVYATTHAALKIMSKQNNGSIINISSVGSIAPSNMLVAYNSVKALVNNLTINIATQVGKFNVRCNAILPGLIVTDASLKNLPEDFLREFVNSTPLNKPGKPEDIANLATFLASDLSSYITGQLIAVSGGFGITTPMFSYLNKK